MNKTCEECGDKLAEGDATRCGWCGDVCPHCGLTEGGCDGCAG